MRSIEAGFVTIRIKRMSWSQQCRGTWNVPSQRLFQITLGTWLNLKLRAIVTFNYMEHALIVKRLSLLIFLRVI